MMNSSSRSTRRKVLIGSMLAFGCMTALAKAEGKPIRIAFPSGMNGQIVVAMEKAGIAEKNGLSPTFTAFQYGPPMMEALAAGSIDAVVTSLMPVTSYAAKFPGDVKITAVLGNSSHSLMVAKDSPVKTPADLTGKKLGVSFGSDSHLDTLVWLRDAGLEKKVELINVAPAELTTGLNNNSVDAIVIRQPQVRRLQELSGARILHTWPFRFVSIVKSKYIAEHPDAYQKYLKSLRDAMFYVSQNHTQVAEWFGAHLRVDPKIVEAVSADDPNYAAKQPSDIDISVNDSARKLISTWVEDAHQYKLIRSKVDLTTLFP